MFGKTVFHVDVNSAYLSWEAVYRLEHLGASRDLREIPSAVAGDLAKRHGIILAKSIPAKKYRIRTGESIPEALAKCPELVLVPPHYDLYEKASAALIGILKEYSPDVEQYSIDEAYVDMTGMESLMGPAQESAHRLKDQIRRELGFTVNIGISSNKLLAKMASDFKKPDRVHSLWPEEIRDKMWPLPVEDLFYVGQATAKKLHSMGIRTIGQLAATDLGLLKSHLKSHGEVIWNFAHGYDASVVEKEPQANKSYGCSVTIPFDVTDASVAKLVLLSLAETAGSRLRKDDKKAELVTVGMKDWEFRYISHQQVLREATDITNEIHRESCRLFDEIWDGTPIRHLGIYAGRVKDQDDIRQLDMFPAMDYGRQRVLDHTVDEIRSRFGKDSVKRAAFVGLEIPHMAGGIADEKRRVDYKKIEKL